MAKFLYRISQILHAIEFQELEMAASIFVEHISRLSKSHIYGNRHHQKSHIKPNILLISYRRQHLALISKFVKSLLISKKKVIKSVVVRFNHLQMGFVTYTFLTIFLGRELTRYVSLISQE